MRAVLDAWNRRDVEAAAALCDPEVEYVNPPNALEPGTRRGLDELRMVVSKQWEFMGDARQEIVALHERGERIISEVKVSRTMPGSEATIENRILSAWTVRDGLVRRLEVLGGGSEFEAAREAAGLG